VELVIAGESNKAIARRMGISRYTAEDHLRSVYLKTGCQGREPLLAALIG
jgi:DNA-binding CsgD family transcriptional regulator